MTRAWSIFLSILLGAAVVGVGTGYFLHLANLDRERLAAEAQDAKSAADKAVQEREQAIQEANRKLNQANEEVGKAQASMQALEWERKLLAAAKPLIAPARAQNWPSVISTELGVSLRYPPGSRETANDIYGLTLSAGNPSANQMDAHNSATDSQPWFALTPFDPQMQSQYTSRLTSSTEVTFFIGGHAITGRSGFLSVTSSRSVIPAAALAVIENGTSTKLIWIQNPPKQTNRSKREPADTWQDVLATLDFQK